MPQSTSSWKVHLRRSTRLTTRATATSAKTSLPSYTNSQTAAQSKAISSSLIPQRALSFDSNLSSPPFSNLESNNIYNNDIAHTRELETIQDKAGEVACENAGRLEDMENDQSMETEDVQNGASRSVAFKPVEVDELTELDKAGIDNLTSKAGVDNSTELKKPGTDNLMELDKVL